MDKEIVLLNMEIPRSVRDEFKIVAKRRRLSMSALLFQHIQRLIREEKEKSPESFPDYSPSSVIVDNETTVDRMILDATYELFGDKDITPEAFRSMMTAVKQLLEVRENSDHK